MTGKIRILMVDDNREMVELLGPALQRNGYEVFEAFTGQGCLDMARETLPDLVLLDVVLPDINGLEVCRRLKADPALEQSLVVLISGHATLPEDTIAGLKCGADEYIARPIQLFELLARVGSMARIQQTRAALRESEARWQSLVHHAPDWIFTLDADWRIQFVSRPLPGLTAEEMIGRPLQKFVPAEYRGRVTEALREVCDTGQPVSYEIPFGSGSQERWYWHHAGTVRGGDKPPLSIIIASDITDRKKAEQNIQQYADIVRNMQVGLHVWQLPEGHDLRRFILLASNPAAALITGVPNEAILGKSIGETFPRLLETDIPKQLAEVIESGTPRDLGEVAYEDQRVAFGVFASRAFPLPNRCVGVVFENVTQRHQFEKKIKELNQVLEKRVVERTRELEQANLALRLEIAGHRASEEALRESEKRFRSVFEGSPDVLYTVSREGKFTSLNPAFEKVTGWPREEWLRKPFGELLHPQDRARALERFRKTISGERSRMAEYRVRLRTGSYMVAEVVTTPQVENGQVVGLIGFGRDITERKAVEQRCNLEASITRILAEAASFEESARHILRTICETIGWDRGELWIRNGPDETLGCVEVSKAAAARTPTFDAITKLTRLRPGEGLPGRAWVQGEPVVIDNVLVDAGFVRVAAAKKAGFHGAFAFPILTAGGVEAVMTFFSHEIRQGDGELLKIFALLGSQIGQFIDRKRAEEALRQSDRRFSSFMNNTSALAWMKDEDYKYVYINPPWFKLFARLPADVLGKNDFQIWPKKTAEELRTNDEIVQRTGKTLETYESVPAPGDQVKYFWVFKFPFDAGGRRFVGGMAVDITERMMAENALRGLPRRILEAEEAERHRVARELHDSVNQILTSVRFRIESVEEKTSGRNLGWRRDVEKAKTLLGDAVQEVRRISHNLRPSELDDLGLVPAVRRMIQDFRERASTQVVFRCPRVTRRFASPIELAVYRVIQEALSNVEKHSRAQKVWVTLQVDGALIHLRIKDNGRGFSPAKGPARFWKKGGFGLTNIRERTAFLGGRMTLESSTGEGTEIQVSIPFQQARRMKGAGDA